MYCECHQDGYCQRYHRNMSGRFREICQGTNVDPDTATAFREQWLREANVPSLVSDGAIPLILKSNQMPGDTVAMTAALYSLHKAHPDKYMTSVDTYFPEVFESNPDVAKIDLESSATAIQIQYPAIHQCNNRGIHFMQAWCEFLGTALGVPIPLLTNRPRLYFNTPDPPVEDFWVICSGGNHNFTNKLWGHHNYQSVVDRLRRTVRFVQVGLRKDEHLPLHGTENMVGITTLRELFDLVRRARGVLCGVSLLMHVAAALEKPAVVIAGGREPVQWNAYPKQQYVHTVGVLPCQSTQGHVGQACWRSRVVPLGDGSIYDQSICERPVDGLPQCMRMISPAEVAGLVLRYNA